MIDYNVVQIAEAAACGAFGAAGATLIYRLAKWAFSDKGPRELEGFSPPTVRAAEAYLKETNPTVAAMVTAYHSKPTDNSSGQEQYNPTQNIKRARIRRGGMKEYVIPILKMIAAGSSNVEIGEKLSVNPVTVSAIRQNKYTLETKKIIDDFMSKHPRHAARIVKSRNKVSNQYLRGKKAA